MSNEAITRDDFVPVGVATLTDLELLPRRFDMFASEVRSSFELMANKILPTLDRLRETLVDLADRVARIERWQDATDHRLAALEAARPTQRKARR